MRTWLILSALALTLAACGGDGVAIRGSMREADDGLRAWVAGGPGPVEVLPGESFEIEGIEPGTVELRFAEGEREIARMEIRDLPPGAELTLEEIRVEREHDLAFPSAVRTQGARVVTINGIRMADPDRLPEEVETAGSVLAINGDADALLVRPRDPDLPDLRVVVTPGTEAVGEAGEPVSLDDLDAGDPLRVEGRTANGYLVARRIVVASGAPEGAYEPAAGGDDRRGRGPAEIPPGHRPPPGECRVWHPGRPPGQQPPPARCDRLIGRVPVGAFILYKGKEWDTRYDWERHERRHRGSVPGVILRLMDSIRG